MLAPRIALRYLLAPKSHRAVNVISAIAVAGVAVATAAIMVVLSVFNGFSELSRRHLAVIDPDLKIVPRAGKVFGGADSIVQIVGALPEVAAAMPSLQERALAMVGGRQMPVIVKGVVPESYNTIVRFASTMIDGEFSQDCLPSNATPAALAIGTAVQLRVTSSPGVLLQLYVPRRRGRINPANPAAAYRSADVAVTGVFAVDQPEYDADFIITDISMLRRLLDYDAGSAGSVELRLRPGCDPGRAAETVGAAVGPDFSVLTRDRQQPETFRMISVEKWVTFMMLVFILIVASFNIVTTLSLLVIEKRHDMDTLRALGAGRNTVSAVFAWEGAFITLAGGFAGIALGLLLAWVQQQFGIIKLGADPEALTISEYPVHIEGYDILAVALTVVALSVLLAQLARLFTKKIH